MLLDFIAGSPVCGSISWGTVLYKPRHSFTTAFAGTTALLLFAGATGEPAWAQRPAAHKVAALQTVQPLPPDTVAPPPASSPATPQSDGRPQAPTQNWALPTPGRAQQNNQNQGTPPLTPNQQPNRIQTPTTTPRPNAPAQQNPVAPKGSRRGKKTPEPEPVAVVPPPEQPAQPLRPSQMPPTTPQVTYRDGMLSIVAENSTLADILAAVRKQTGAAIEMPPSASNERVVMRIGPAPPRDVVSALLSGSPYDYVIVGAENSPTALRRVIVSSRQSGGEMAPSPNPMPQPSYQRSAMPGMGAASAADAEAADQAEETPQPPRVATPIPMPGMGQPAAAAAGGQPAAQPANPGSPPTVKTPEQLLEELKRMQQQQQPQPAQPPARPPL